MRLSPVPWMTSDGQNQPSPSLMPQMNVTSLYAAGTRGPSAAMRRRSDDEKTINGGESVRHAGCVDAELTTAPNGPSGMRQDQSNLREQAVRGSCAGGLAESAVFGNEMRWSQESGRYVRESMQRSNSEAGKDPLDAGCHPKGSGRRSSYYASSQRKEGRPSEKLLAGWGAPVSASDSRDGENVPGYPAASGGLGPAQQWAVPEGLHAPWGGSRLEASASAGQLVVDISYSRDGCLGPSSNIWDPKAEGELIIWWQSHTFRLPSITDLNCQLTAAATQHVLLDTNKKKGLAGLTRKTST
eukprot:scaffold58967_cov35-Prasinocladus_malaysianus.AAC.1